MARLSVHPDQGLPPRGRLVPPRPLRRVPNLSVVTVAVEADPLPEVAAAVRALAESAGMFVEWVVSCDRVDPASLIRHVGYRWEDRDFIIRLVAGGADPLLYGVGVATAPLVMLL